MKLALSMIILVLSTACCSLKHPLDGKAQSSCEREKLANEYCHGQVKHFDYGKVECK